MLFIQIKNLSSITINKFLSFLPMSNQEHKFEFESLSSLSMERNLRELSASNMFKDSVRKSSFDFVNVFKDSAHYDKIQLKNSLQLLSSNIVLEQKTSIQTKDLFKYDENEKNRMKEAGVNPILIGQAISDSEEQEQSASRNFIKPSQSREESFEIEYYLQQYKPKNYLSIELEQLLRDRQIPLVYVKGLLLAKDDAEVKSVRRIKVERYLEKRRKKTWNRKICYNCRQKVAQERLRIKGKFIKKRRAMELLRLTKPIPMVELKKLLEQELKDKTHAEIEQLLRKK